MDDRKLIIICITILACICIICYTAYTITTPRDDTVNNTTSTVNNSSANTSSGSTAGTIENSDKYDGIDTSYGDGKYYDIPVFGTSGQQTVHARWIGRDKQSGENMYELDNGEISGGTYYSNSY